MSTTVRVSRPTRDAIRELAESDGVTIDEVISRLARSERQRRMGEALADPEVLSADEPWLDLAASLHAIDDTAEHDVRR